MKDVIEKLILGEHEPITVQIRELDGDVNIMQANRTMLGYDSPQKINLTVSSLRAISELVSPSPSPVTWEELKNDVYTIAIKVNKVFDCLSTRYPLPPPMEWVNINEATPRLKTYVDVWIEERQMSFMAYMDENFQWQSSYPVVYSSKIEYYKYRDTTKPPSPQK